MPKYWAEIQNNKIYQSEAFGVHKGLCGNLNHVKNFIFLNLEKFQIDIFCCSEALTNIIQFLNKVYWIFSHYKIKTSTVENIKKQKEEEIILSFP